MTQKFEIGDRVVVPVRDAPQMIITGVHPRKDDHYTCLWFVSGMPQEGAFPASILKKDRSQS